MQIKSLDSVVYISDSFSETLTEVVSKFAGNRRYFIVVDENTKDKCFEHLNDIKALQNATIIEIKSGEENKTIETTCKIWSSLIENNADRSSVLINLGGGVVCDMGGFAASTYKRGIDFINIPTTLLAQVDASIGGKLGIDYQGLKNEIGLFRSPNYVIIDIIFLKTIDTDNFLSGYAEMVKHSLIYSGSHWQQLKKYNPQQPDLKKLKSLLNRSILIKNDFVKNDPREKNIRRALNFGHTFGHAFESLMLEKKQPILHGKAVAYGMIAETWLSHKKLGLSALQCDEIIQYLLSNYGKNPLDKKDYSRILELMTHDKKNEAGNINFSLLSEIGIVEINQICSKTEIYATLDYFHDLMA